MIADDCSQFSVTDATGIYPESPGGYAESGEGTATRPEYLDVHLFLVVRIWNADGTYVDTYPETQPAQFPYPSEVSYPWLDEFGDVAPDQSLQGFWITAPVDVDIDEALALSGPDLLPEYAQVEWAVGSFDIPILCQLTNCRNDAMYATIDKVVRGGCVSPKFAQLNSMLQGITDNLNAAQGEVLLTQPQFDYYAEAQAEIEEMRTVCTNPGCNC